MGAVLELANFQVGSLLLNNGVRVRFPDRQDNRGKKYADPIYRDWNQNFRMKELLQMKQRCDRRPTCRT